MPLMSRFRKDHKADDDPLDGMQDAEEEEEEGLFMPTKPGLEGAGLGQGPAVQEGAGETDELLETSPVESLPLDPAEPSTEGSTDPDEEEEAVEGGGPEVQIVPAGAEGSGQSGDDPLALFRASAAESGLGDLTGEIEDVPVDELLAELRELRAMLVPGQTSADSGSE